MSTLEIITPDITQYNLHLERTDKLYNNCMWARINLDNKNWTLTATSDCGDFAYSWRPEDCRTFKQLLVVIEKEYLLSKISVEDTFILSETIEEIKRVFSYEEYPEFCKWLDEEMDYYPSTAEEFANLIYEHDFEDIFDFENIYEYAVYDYSQRAKVFAEIFFKHIIPAIKRELNNEVETV